MGLSTLIGALGLVFLLGLLTFRRPIDAPEETSPDTGGGSGNGNNEFLSPSPADLEARIRAIIAVENPRVSEEDRAVIAQKIVTYSEQAGLDPMVVTAVVKQESNFDKFARGSAGEWGLMQIMPATFNEVLRRYPDIPKYPITYLAQIGYNLQIGTRYLKWCLDRAQGDLRYFLQRPEFKNDPVRAALYMYNGGFRLGIPAAIAYQNSVMAHYERFA